MKLLSVIVLFINLLVIVKSQTKGGCFSIVEYDGNKSLSTPQLFINIKNISRYGVVNLRVTISIPDYVSVKNYDDGLVLVNKTENPIDKSVSLRWKFTFPTNNINSKLVEIVVNNEIYICRDVEDYTRFLNYKYNLPLEKNSGDTDLNEECVSPIKNSSNPFNPKDLPWLASVYLRTNDTRTLVCSGSFITNRHVLTSASCVLFNNVDEIEIGYGVSELLETDYGNGTGSYYKIKNFQVNPDYDGESTADLAILEIVDENVETRDIDPVCIWSALESESNTFYIGDWNEESKFQELKYFISEPDNCLKLYPSAANISQYLDNNKLFCATVNKSNTHTNFFSKKGNSLIGIDEDGSYHLQGVLTSFFDDLSLDGLFVNVDEHFTWIKEVTETMY